MIVRSFRLQDYVQVMALLKAALSDSCYHDTVDALGKQLSWDSELVLVSEVNQEIAGVIIGTIDNDQGFYYRIAVARNHQRKGYAKAMIQALRKRFVNRNVKKIAISVDDHNESIASFYESLGYGAGDFERNYALRIVNE